MLFYLAFVNTLDGNGLNGLKDLFTFSSFFNLFHSKLYLKNKEKTDLLVQML